LTRFWWFGLLVFPTHAHPTTSSGLAHEWATRELVARYATKRFALACGEDGVERERERKDKQGYPQTVKDIPAAVCLLPVGRKRGGLELRDVFGDGDEHRDGDNDDKGPEAYGDGERCERGCMAADDGFRDEKHKIDAVPERHDEAEKRGKEAERFGLRLFVELAHGGVDEGGDGELDADHEAEGEDGDDIENQHDADTRVDGRWFTWGRLMDGICRKI